MNLNHTPEYWYGLRIPHQYRTPYLSTGTEGVRYTGKNWFLGTEMVRNTGNIWKLSTGTGTGKIGGKITVRSTVRCTDRFWKAKYGYGIRTEHIRVLDQSIINTQSNLNLQVNRKLPHLNSFLNWKYGIMQRQNLLFFATPTRLQNIILAFSVLSAVQ